jgi:HYR domain
MTSRGVGTVLALALVTAATAVAPAASGPQVADGSLNFRAVLGVVYDAAPCPPSVPKDGTGCSARKGQGAVKGLGHVSDDYLWAIRVGPPTCPANLSKPIAVSTQLVVAGKGEIILALADGANCVGFDPVRNEPQEFTITGGAGAFAGASGTGRVERALAEGVGSETWTGTLAAPGHEFDLTPPKLVGATPKTVQAAKRAKTAKVIYKVAAVDAVDGAVRALCQPKSGSRFKVGRTTVRCDATDSSANTAKAAFAVTVKPRR